MFVELEDGRQSFLPIKDFPILLNATQQQREEFEIVDGYALHWPALGEDLSIEDFFIHQEISDLKRKQSLSVSKK
ncbi:MAG: DUF2442 domain-containing protein [Parafilimonas sp.]